MTFWILRSFSTARPTWLVVALIATMSCRTSSPLRVQSSAPSETLLSVVLRAIDQPAQHELRVDPRPLRAGIVAGPLDASLLADVSADELEERNASLRAARFATSDVLSAPPCVYDRFGIDRLCPARLVFVALVGSTRSIDVGPDSVASVPVLVKAAYPRGSALTWSDVSVVRSGRTWKVVGVRHSLWVD